MKVDVSIVTYRTPVAEISGVLEMLSECPEVGTVYVIDNGSDHKVREVCDAFNNNVIYQPCDNVGFGCAHNKAIERSMKRMGTPYHLVLNADVQFNSYDISTLLAEMEQGKDIGLMHPKMVDFNGDPIWSARLMPSPFDLILRRFMPKRMCKKSRDSYLMKNVGNDELRNVGYVQGSFMLLRKEALRQVGMFDTRFFMYPEDIDLSRRIHRSWRVVECRKVTVRHSHRAASYHSMRMLWVHIVNMVRYFNKWGWIIDKERKEINAALMGK